MAFWSKKKSESEPLISKVLDELREVIKGKHVMQSIIRIKREKDVLMKEEQKRAKYLESIGKSKGLAFLFEEGKKFDQIEAEMGEIAARERELVNALQQLAKTEYYFFDYLKAWEKILAGFKIDISHDVFRLKNLLKFEVRVEQGHKITNDNIISIIRRLHHDESEDQSTEEKLENLLNKREHLIREAFKSFVSNDEALQEHNRKETEDLEVLKQKILAQVNVLAEIYRKIVGRINIRGVAVGEDEKAFTEIAAVLGQVRPMRLEESMSTRNLFMAELISLIETNSFEKAREYIAVGRERGIVSNNILNLMKTIIDLTEGTIGKEIVAWVIKLVRDPNIISILKPEEFTRLQLVAQHLRNQFNRDAQGLEDRSLRPRIPDVRPQRYIFLEDFHVTRNEILDSEEVWKEFEQESKAEYDNTWKDQLFDKTRIKPKKEFPIHKVQLFERKNRSVLNGEQLKRLIRVETRWKELLEQQIYACIIRMLNTDDAKSMLNQAELSRLSIAIRHVRARRVSAPHHPEIGLAKFLLVDELILDVEKDLEERSGNLPGN